MTTNSENVGARPVEAADQTAQGRVSGPTGFVTREAAESMGSMPGIACVVRDEDGLLVWCNEAFASLSKRPAAELVGTKMDAFIPKQAADERSDILKRVIESGEPLHYYQWGADQRLLCGAFPIDSASFGHRGVMVTVQSATGISGPGMGTAGEIPVLGTPCFDGLDVLSPAELRVLHHLAKGHSTAGIGELLCRSAKTIEKQIESIHRKLGTGSRAELVKLAVERGIQAFDVDAWERIIEGARSIRRSGDDPRRN